MATGKHWPCPLLEMLLTLSGTHVSLSYLFPTSAQIGNLSSFLFATPLYLSVSRASPAHVLELAMFYGANMHCPLREHAGRTARR